jgi:predicted nuclease of predicted toxin-antitoxin system
VRVLLDESIPIDFARDLTGLDAQTVRGLGWAGLKNGALLQQAAGHFGVLVTMDKNLQFQQNLTAHAIGVVLIRARSNRVDDLRPLVPQILEAVSASEPGKIRVVGA